MPKSRDILLGLAVAAIILVAPVAYGATIDTFAFVEPNVYENGVANGQLYEFAGSFTGTVESGGWIELTDLSAFQVRLDDSNGNPIPPFSMGLPSLTLFSFDINGGVSSLDFAGTPSLSVANFCIGAATSLDAACTGNFNYTYPVGTIGVLLFPGPADFSSSFADLTLVSSVTTPPPATAPEPRFGLLVGIAVLAGWWKAFGKADSQKKSRTSLETGARFVFRPV